MTNEEKYLVRLQAKRDAIPYEPFSPYPRATPRRFQEAAKVLNSKKNRNKFKTNKALKVTRHPKPRLRRK